VNKVLLSLVIGCVYQSAFSQDISDDFSNDFSEDMGWEEESMLMDELPMVLTASRLKQPKAEVPASVTVITSKHIKLWGARTLPELMKFVPGMFVGHGDDENNASVAYHAANPSIMRRLQVLVDGRSVYKAAIANVVWDDIPLAIEDIERIEITRGPNAASYGANSYSGVINILTRHPEDSLGTRVSARRGTNGVQDVYVSRGFNFNDTSVRLSLANKADEGFDGAKAESGDDDLRDGRRHGFFTAALSHQIDLTSTFDFQLGYKDGKTEIRKSSDLYQTTPDKENENAYVWGRWQHEFDQDHQVSVQAYWQKDDTQQEFTACVPTLSLDPTLREIYRSNPDWADVVGLYMPGGYGNNNDITNAVDGILADAVSADVLSSSVSALLERPVVITDTEVALAKQALENIPDLANDIGEVVCGQSNNNISEQRIDLEWQDTMRWSKQLRTVAGLSYRQDSADSESFFKGRLNNEIWRAFMNAEYKLQPSVILNLGAMYEYESKNNDALSPRVALNMLLAPQQSIRFVISQALRSPDLLESHPNYSYGISPLTNLDGSDNNYLNLNAGAFYMEQARDDEKHLKEEEITSYEIGYYHAMDNGLELDLKVFYEELTDLISEPISLNSRSISNDNKMYIDGAELQLSGQYNVNHSYWLTYSYVNTDVSYSGEIIGEDGYDVETSEQLLSSQNSVAASWMYSSQNWNMSISYFNQDTRQQRESNIPYERFQLNVTKPFTIAGVNVAASYYIQHNRQPYEPLNYRNQKYSSPNIYYAQLSLEF
jgi:iron complex outermembrane receptor protein